MSRTKSEVSLVRSLRRLRDALRSTSVAVRLNGAAHYVGHRGRREYLKRLMPMRKAQARVKPATVPTPFRKVK